MTRDGCQPGQINVDGRCIGKKDVLSILSHVIGNASVKIDDMKYREIMDEMHAYFDTRDETRESLLFVKKWIKKLKII